MYKHNDEMVFADLDFSAQHCWNLLDLFRTNSDSIRVLDLSYNQGMQCKLEDILERMGVGSGTCVAHVINAYRIQKGNIWLLHEFFDVIRKHTHEGRRCRFLQSLNNALNAINRIFNAIANPQNHFFTTNDASL